MALFGRKKEPLAEPVEPPAPRPTLPPAPALGADGRRSLTDHRDYLLSLVEPLPPFGMALLDAWGLALCEEIRLDDASPSPQSAPAAEPPAADLAATTPPDQLMARGQRLDAPHIGLLAGAGIDKVLARPRPRVVVVSIGADLVDPARPLAEGQRHDQTSFLVAAQARAEGCQVWRVPVFDAAPDRVREVVGDQLIRADLVVTIGGLDDLLPAVLPELGMAEFVEVAINPGGPMGFGLVGDDRVPVLALDDDPWTARVHFEVFVRPIIRTLMGVEPVHHQPGRAIVGQVFRGRRGRVDLVPAEISTEGGRRFVRPVDDDPLTLARTSALVLLDDQTDLARAGQAVRVWELGNG